jgi:hypothetical protein
MRCAQMEQKLPAFVEGDLGPAEAARCAGHLAACPACRALEADLRLLAGALAAWQPPAADLPSGASAAAWILERAVATRSSTLRRARLAYAAAALLGLVALSGWWISTGRGGRAGTPPIVRRPPASSPGAASRPEPILPQVAIGNAAAARHRESPAFAEPEKRPSRRARRDFRTSRRFAARPDARLIRRAAPGRGRSQPEAPRRLAPAPGILVEAEGGGARVRRTIRQPGSRGTPVLVIADDYERGRQVSIVPQAEAMRVEDGASGEE